ncbi:MAG: hypothetical protein WA632_05700 [Gallionella sp.]
MIRRNKYSAVRSTLVGLMTALGLAMLIAANSFAKEEPLKEPPKQSGSYLIKFYEGVDAAQIKAVADYYGAQRVDPLSDSEAAGRKKPELWRKLRFEAVIDLKDIARRIVLDNRVDEVE